MFETKSVPIHLLDVDKDGSTSNAFIYGNEVRIELGKKPDEVFIDAACSIIQPEAMTLEDLDEIKAAQALISAFPTPDGEFFKIENRNYQSRFFLSKKHAQNLIKEFEKLRYFFLRRKTPKKILEYINKVAEQEYSKDEMNVIARRLAYSYLSEHNSPNESLEERDARVENVTLRIKIHEEQHAFMLYTGDRIMLKKMYLKINGYIDDINKSYRHQLPSWFSYSSPQYELFSQIDRKMFFIRAYDELVAMIFEFFGQRVLDTSNDSQTQDLLNSFSDSQLRLRIAYMLQEIQNKVGDDKELRDQICGVKSAENYSLTYASAMYFMIKGFFPTKLWEHNGSKETFQDDHTIKELIESVKGIDMDPKLFASKLLEDSVVDKAKKALDTIWKDVEVDIMEYKRLYMGGKG